MTNYQLNINEFLLNIFTLVVQSKIVGKCVDLKETLCSISKLNCINLNKTFGFFFVQFDFKSFHMFHSCFVQIISY